MLVVIKKYKFYTKKTNFIKFIIKLKWISIDLKKIEAIINQQNLKDITSLNFFFRILQLLLKVYCKLVR